MNLTFWLMALIIWEFAQSSSMITSSSADPCHVIWDNTRNGSSVDCSNRHLKVIPKDLPDDSVILNFQGNDLIILRNSSFMHLPRLEVLNLANCGLKGIEPYAFKGLFSLQSLNLDHNQLPLDNNTYPKDVFRPLEDLKELDLRYNDPRLSGTTPDEIFRHLTNLENLALDTFKEEVFGNGFTHLKKLKVLTLYAEFNDRYFCGITRLRNDTFKAFENSSIAELNLRRCRLYGIESGTFLPLLSVSVINMDTVKFLPVDTAIRSMYGLNGKNISRLLLPHCYYPMRPQLKDIRKQCIDETTTASLTDLCVNYLDISHNRIIYMDRKFVSTFSRCLKYLDISHNTIVGDVFVFFSLSSMKHLEYLDLSYQLSAASFDERNTESSTEQCDDCDPRGNIAFYQNEKNYKGISITLPPSIKELKARSIATNLGYMNVSRIYGGKHLSSVDLRDNGIKYMRIYITGLENVEKLDLSDNKGSEMTETFLTSFIGLTELSLRYMNFDENALAAGGSVYRGIRSLTKIKSLDLSGNNIRFLSEDFFRPLPETTNLYLSDNGFVSVPLNLKLVPGINMLDLSLNSITFLHEEETEELEVLGKKNNMVLKLSGNPITCSCQSLSFVRWLFTTSVTLDKGGNYSCVTDDGLITSTMTVYKNFNLHWTSCQSHFWLPFSITLIFFFALVIVSIMLINTNWTRIRHHLMVLLGKGVKRVGREAFVKDAYIAHSDSYEDYKFVSRDVRLVLEERYNLRLILPDRDFMVGNYVADNVVDSVNNSWKTILIATQEFLEDRWSYFIMKTAAYSVSDTNPNRVILLLIGNINRAQIPRDLLTVTEEDDIFQMDNLPGPNEDVWEALKNRILKVYP